MIVYIAPVSGLSDKQQRLNGKRQRKSRVGPLGPNPACSDMEYGNMK
ncbi:Uncharacterised protein [Raoultella ornithinolytica]|nr:Uncharacterised protein [Raoultella ornithinolytica]